MLAATPRLEKHEKALQQFFNFLNINFSMEDILKLNSQRIHEAMGKIIQKTASMLAWAISRTLDRVQQRTVRLCEDSEPGSEELHSEEGAAASSLKKATPMN
eukprot:CAMPEP_0197033726 /NCGR_PEP_ID=MMETSP1384-20130603/12058_1 /TAXON_ID=29189 /ORGANISM="Ammonia sp." /LENGTH=101 /DNA_ID=CAMNT_0042463571 /DNA_START=345 /DNA_END=650 /DNA_ORIENTATION=-